MAPDEERRRSKNRRSRPGKDSASWHSKVELEVGEPPGFVWEDQPAVPAEEGAFVPLQPSPKPEAPEAALDQDVERGEEDAAQVASEPLAALSTKSIVHFVKPSRLLISTTLTIFPRLAQTSPVERMYASQEVSVGTTAAPSPDLELSSHRITLNGGGDGFSPTRSSTAPAAVHDDQIDLATASFTTTDPLVLRIYTGESPEEERFIQRLQAVASLVGSGEVNAEVLADSMAGLITAYRELGGTIPDGADSERVLGVAVAAEILGVTKEHVAYMAKRGEIGEKTGGRYLFSKQELEAHRHRERSKGGRPRKSPS